MEHLNILLNLIVYMVVHLVWTRINRRCPHSFNTFVFGDCPVIRSDSAQHMQTNAIHVCVYVPAKVVFTMSKNVHIMHKR